VVNGNTPNVSFSAKALVQKIRVLTGKGSVGGVDGFLV